MYIVEVDIRQSADGVLFILHDDTLERMAGIDPHPRGDDDRRDHQPAAAHGRWRAGPAFHDADHSDARTGA
ncbi:glycerophosphodiester phosphodiesterase family protein [Rhizobium beringeri]